MVNAMPYSRRGASLLCHPILTRLIRPLTTLAALTAMLSVIDLAQSTASSPLVVKLTIHDTIQPITAEYMKRGLDAAASRHAAAVLISLGTPGGLLDSTREMVADIEASPVPVIIFIEPSGSRAGSAGFFLLEAADVAAMAPGTNAGAAHPILEGTTMDPVLKEKIENDAAAFLRSYVTVRGRDAKDAEDAVRNSKSFSEAEALKLNLIDVVAPDDNALLAALNGSTIKRFHGESTKLDFTHATIDPLLPSTRERLLTRLTSPDLDVLLLLCGASLIYLEFNVPGTIVPGALGVLMMLLAVFGLNLRSWCWRRSSPATECWVRSACCAWSSGWPHWSMGRRRICAYTSAWPPARASDSASSHSASRGSPSRHGKPNASPARKPCSAMPPLR
jgi:membrane-bound serine protease (ClpP class)